MVNAASRLYSLCAESGQLLLRPLQGLQNLAVVMYATVALIHRPTSMRSLDRIIHILRVALIFRHVARIKINWTSDRVSS